MSQDEQRGYQLVDPGLTQPLSYDERTRCRSYLMRQIGDIMPVPKGVLFELTPAQYLGGPYPVIGLYTETFVDTDANLCRLSFVLSERLGQFIKQIGLERLLALSSQENVRWDDVLEPYREALLRCRYDAGSTPD